MSRLVSSIPAPVVAPPAVPAPAVGGAPAAPSRDDYLTKVAKYVPVEFVAGYLFFQNLISFGSGANPASPEFTMKLLILSGFTAVLWILSPFYFYYHGRKDGKPWKTQAIVSGFAFPIWIYAIGGSLVSGWSTYLASEQTATWAQQLLNANYLSAGILVLFSVVTGFIDQ